MNPSNFLFIFSDQHTRNLLGCHGNPLVQTPNLDRLAQRGVRFTNAITPCPICVPARAALATGRYIHQTGHWDNAFPYHGEMTSWHHRLREQGHAIDLIGKLHFRSAEDDNGFRREIEPLHVVDGMGDILGSIRDDPPFRDKTKGILESGPGDSSYLRYDVRNADNAVAWLADAPDDDKPWALFVSLVCPHPPYIAPPELYDLYPLDEIELPPQWRKGDWPDHPVLNFYRRFFGIEEGFSEEVLRRYNAAYYGAVTHLDRQIGRILDALEENDLTEGTRLLYSSDHGESLGARGLSGKFTLYAESVGVPMILAGPEVPEGRVNQTPVSLVDIYPTILEAVGLDLNDEEADLPGRSLLEIGAAADEDRIVFSEYHAVGSQHASYMVRNRRYKLIYYVGAPNQLFDLENDPEERTNLAESEEHGPVRTELEAELRNILDPEAVDAQARAAQRARVEEVGGEDFVRRRGAFDNSPTPDEKPQFRQFQ